MGGGFFLIQKTVGTVAGTERPDLLSTGLSLQELGGFLGNVEGCGRRKENAEGAEVRRFRRGVMEERAVAGR
jgi:hypothetical protein